MQNTVIKLNTNDYDLDYYQDKAGNEINFNIFLNSENYSHLSQLIVQAIIKEEVAGYISLLYLTEECKVKYYDTAWDFYCTQKMATNLKSLLSVDSRAFVKEVNLSLGLDFASLDDFKDFASQAVAHEYKKFISYYLNKPFPEIVTVYSDADKKYKDFSEFPFLNIDRKPTNFLRQGVATAIHHCACAILKKQNMHLYKSSNQTPDGESMWQQLEKNSSFLKISDAYYGSSTTDRKKIVEVKRKGLTI